MDPEGITRIVTYMADATVALERINFAYHDWRGIWASAGGTVSYRWSSGGSKRTPIQLDVDKYCKRGIG